MPFSASPPALFPTYLLPTFPGRQRRQSSVSSTSSQLSAPSSPTAGATGPDAPPFVAGHASHLRCSRCLADLALASQIISKGFTGRHGRAYLVAPAPAHTSSSSSVMSAAAAATSTAAAAAAIAAQPNLPNTFTHKPVPRQLVTGAHTVADLACAHCGSVLGWKYVGAADEAQRYKVGKVILETKRVCRVSTWEAGDGGGDDNGDDDVDGGGGAHLGARGAAVDEVEFDSQDEDECEDLFMGVWTPRLAAKRRMAKGFAKGSLPE